MLVLSPIPPVFVPLALSDRKSQNQVLFFKDGCGDSRASASSRGLRVGFLLRLPLGLRPSPRQFGASDILTKIVNPGT